jgi:hypothetical protein
MFSSIKKVTMTTTSEQQTVITSTGTNVSGVLTTDDEAVNDFLLLMGRLRMISKIEVSQTEQLGFFFSNPVYVWHYTVRNV